MVQQVKRVPLPLFAHELFYPIGFVFLFFYFFYHFIVNRIGRVCVESLLTWVSWKKLLPLKIYTCEWFELSVHILILITD